MSIQEMVSLKESAIQQENYSLADQTRTKLTALRLQLLKMEHQFNADLITNFITSWHDDLALSLNMLISGGKMGSPSIKKVEEMCV